MIASDAQLAMNRALSAWRFGGGAYLFGASTSPQFVDLTGPTVSSVTVAANGTTVTVVFNEAVTGSTGCSLTLGTSNPLTYSSGSGTNTLVFTAAWLVGQSTTPTFNYSAGNIVDLAGNALATISGGSVTNNSTTWTPQTLGLSTVVGWFPANGTYEVTAGGGGGTAAAGAACGRWADRNGSGNHADAASAGVRPTRAADGRGVYGNATDQTMTTGASMLPNPNTAGFSYFWKWKRASTGANSEGVIGHGDGSSRRWGGFGGGGTGGYFGNASVTVVTPADTNENVVGLNAVSAGDNSVSTYDGTYTSTGNALAAAAMGLMLLSYTSGGFSTDTIIELVCFSRTLSAGEITSLRTYLAGV